MTYLKFYELAAYLLRDHVANDAERKALADEIQIAAEDWIACCLPQRWPYRCGACSAYNTEPGQCPHCRKGFVRPFSSALPGDAS